MNDREWQIFLDGEPAVPGVVFHDTAEGAVAWWRATNGVADHIEVTAEDVVEEWLKFMETNGR